MTNTHFKGERLHRKNTAAQHSKWMRRFFRREIEKTTEKLEGETEPLKVLMLKAALREDQASLKRFMSRAA